jgi:hypothetical protein
MHARWESVGRNSLSMDRSPVPLNSRYSSCCFVLSVDKVVCQVPLQAADAGFTAAGWAQLCACNEW